MECMAIASLISAYDQGQFPAIRSPYFRLRHSHGGIGFVTIGAPLRQGFIGIECLEDASPALGCNACIGTIGIHEDLRKRGPLELCRWAIPFIYRPTADQPESNPIWLFSYDPPRFKYKLGG